MIHPSKINAKNNFFGTCWENCECETIARNIVIISQNSGGWKKFTWSQYQNLCGHQVTDSEKLILDGFVKSRHLHQDARGAYSVTELFIKALKKYIID